MTLLVRNRVEDVHRWKRVFDAQGDAARAAGLNLIHLWRSVDEADQVYFLFEVEDRGRAETYMSTPEAASVGRRAGVIDGDYHFLDACTA